MKVAMALALAAAVALLACAGPAPSVSPSGAASPSGSAEPTIDPQVGWRLAAAFDRGAQWAYTVRVATSGEAWSALWAELSPGLDEPPIDFSTEIAAVFADGTGGPGNCSERRLDGVVIDADRSLVYARISDPLAPRGCDAMLGGASVFVVGLARAALPAVPFAVQLREEILCCPETEQVIVREL